MCEINPGISLGIRMTPWVSEPRRSASVTRSPSTAASPSGIPTARKARVMKAFSSSAEMRAGSGSLGASGSFPQLRRARLAHVPAKWGTGSPKGTCATQPAMASGAGLRQGSPGEAARNS